MGRVKATPNLAEYLTIGEAAERLGVSRGTLRNWDREGKFKPHRHPINGYRLYQHAEVELLLARVKRAQG